MIMGYSELLSWFENLITELSNIGYWLTQPVTSFGGLDLTPLVLMTGAGLIAFIGVAVVKWVVS